MARRTQVSPFTEISILIWEGIIKKKKFWASRLWFGRRKMPLLGYVPKMLGRTSKKKKKTNGTGDRILLSAVLKDCQSQNTNN